MNKIKTAIIPVGGYGTRFLPATKSIPKEMFPLGKKPIVMHVVEEVIASGITDIIFVVSHLKQSIETFFSYNEILEDYLLGVGKNDKVDELRKIAEMAQFTYVYTKPPYGNGGSLNAVRHILEERNEPFVLIWGDELILSKEQPRLKQCIDAYEKTGKTTISCVEIKDPEKRHLYGMAELKDIEGYDDIKEITQLVEKPSKGEEPSAYAAHGAYVLTPDVFEILDRTAPGKNNELWLSDILNNLQKEKGLTAKIIKDGLYLDCGNPKDYLFSQINYALNYSEDSEEVKKFLNEIK